MGGHVMAVAHAFSTAHILSEQQNAVPALQFTLEGMMDPQNGPVDDDLDVLTQLASLWVP
jgi:hypothetical protein